MQRTYRRLRSYALLAVLLWLCVATRRAFAVASYVQIVLAEGHGVMFCPECDDPLREGSYVPALSTFFNPSGYFVIGELVYGVPNRGDLELMNIDEARGRVVLFDRGKAPFARKVRHAQQAGAIGVVVIDDLSERRIETEVPSAFLQDDRPTAWQGVEIPSVMISATDGERLRSFMALVQMEIMGEMHYLTA
ncbi:hypothetical protein Poli38472_004445 [Pythium oligandrum]|uniref:PA domain-containing protein n=1 Tax=Pythium oligandrum TaxID=41045 RepID=A0A8K1C9X3_PYTOL|nr:hypothetical protein Poli38472_004445 [Pythium oligandrum]|eukprot:TMW59376.1 hypothetical protein Poli38472_004445 [Pythium oligandrum]